MDSHPRWFAAHTIARCEAVAVNHLQHQGFDAFLPRLSVVRRHARKTETVSTPLFPGYVFVCLDLGLHRWRSVNGTRGVTGLIMAGERPCAVPPGIVEGLMARTGPNGTINSLSGLCAGDVVRVVDGPFAGQVGTLLRLDAKGRVEMLISLLRGTVRVRTAEELLAPAW
jgi:transcriptional antiterminator RfaH